MDILNVHIFLLIHSIYIIGIVDTTQTRNDLILMAARTKDQQQLTVGVASGAEGAAQSYQTFNHFQDFNPVNANLI